MVNTNKKGYFWFITLQDAQGEGHLEGYLKDICFLQSALQWVTACSTVMSGKLGSRERNNTSRQEQHLGGERACEGHRGHLQTLPRNIYLEGKSWRAPRARTWWGCGEAVPCAMVLFPVSSVPPNPEETQENAVLGWPGLQQAWGDSSHNWCQHRQHLHLAFLTPPLHKFSPLGDYHGQTVLEGNSTLNYQKIGLKCRTSSHKAFIFRRAPSCPWHYRSVIAAGCYHLFSLSLPFFCSCWQLNPWSSAWQMPLGEGGKSCLLASLGP